MGFVNLNRMGTPSHHGVPGALVTGPTGFLAEFTPGLPTAPRFADRPTPDPLQISTEDWDIMFRAVQLRLAEAVGERTASSFSPQTGEVAGRIQAVVLECVSAMAQLHSALAHQRR
ncbi:MAG: hypothetical protein ABI546_15525 [Polaromonas sp.]